MHAAGYRTPQVLGADRDLVIGAMAIAVMFALLAWAVWAMFVSLAFWIGAVIVLQRMAKADPLMRVILWRHIWYRRFYPAKSGLYSNAPEIPGRWGG